MHRRLSTPIFAYLPIALFIAASPMSHSAEKNSDNAASWRGQSIAEFASEERETMNWKIVNDGVMGGLSKGNMKSSEEGIMKFWGTLSLENNGGFSLLETGLLKFDLSEDLGFLLRVRGDGRTYKMRVESDARYRNNAVSFAGDLPTTKGEWQQVKVPFSTFTGSFRGRNLPESVLNTSMIQRVGIILGDKKPGTFEVEIDWIRTYSKRQNQAAAALKSVGNDKETPGASIIATTEADGRFTVLKKALDAAGLTTFFQWDNPLTVFAPTDEAFAKLPKGTVENLIKPENKEALAEILSYHVSAGNHRLSQILETREFAPLKGEPIPASFSKGRVRVGSAKVIDADILCADGIIHVIDSVLLPPEIEIKEDAQ